MQEGKQWEKSRGGSVLAGSECAVYIFPFGAKTMLVAANERCTYPTLTTDHPAIKYVILFISFNTQTLDTKPFVFILTLEVTWQWVVKIFWGTTPRRVPRSVVQNRLPPSTSRYRVLSPGDAKDGDASRWKIMASQDMERWKSSTNPFAVDLGWFM